jgi:hypothetical protein
MSDRNRLLGSLGLEISDGKDPDWQAAEASAGSEDDRRLLGNLRSLSVMARYFRERRAEAERETPASSGRRETNSGAAPLEPGDHWGHLEILELVGQGSYARVYRARDTQLNREVALKMISAARAEERAGGNTARGRPVRRIGRAPSGGPAASRH